MDRRATDDYGIPLSALMAKAGQAVFEEIQRLLPDGGRITFLCGKGNNGGDGFVAAKLAHENGYHADCLATCEDSDLSGEPRDQMLAAKEAGVPIHFASEPRYRRRTDCLGSRDLIVDAMLGTGAGGEIRGPILDAIQSINRSGTPVLAVDVPSGIHCDTGEELGESIWALKTVTFGLPKPFLFQGTGLEHAGHWDIADIGFPTDLLLEPSNAQLLEIEWVANMIPERLRASHKGDNGHVLIVAGSPTMPGAAVMAAKSALRSGAGLVTVASDAYVCQIVAGQVSECIFLPLPRIGASTAEILLEQESRFDSALIGPGLSQDDSVLEFLASLWKDWKLTTVLDADALNAVAKGVPLPNAECVLTPHPGEMGRLLEASIAEIQSDRFATVKEAVNKLQKCVLLKGHHSIVGEQGQPLAVNRTGNPGMASGGMGDILGGLIATLLAQSVPTYHAAAAGMYWHGLAGDVCAQEIGPIGYSAMDVANALPKARAKIVSSCNYESYSSS